MTLSEIVKNIWHYLKSNALNLRLRSGQHSIFEALYKFLLTGQIQGYLKLPSGIGKTNLAIELAIAGGFKKVLFLVPTLTLVRQTEDRFRQYSGFTSIETFTGTNKNMTGAITVATYQSFQKLARYTNMFNEFDLVIWDEVHHALTPNRQKIMKLFPASTIHLGLTASDQYNEDKRVDNFLPCIAEMSIEEAIKLNLLCSVRCWIATTDIDLSGIKITEGDYDLRAQKRIIDVQRRNQMAVQIYYEYLSGQTCLVTCINIDHALRVAELFQKADIKAQAVWGSNQKHYLVTRDLEKRLYGFQSGEIHVLTTVDLLDTGFDNTLLTSLINLRITSSLVKATQRGGRLLRLFSANDLRLPIAQQMIRKFGGKLSTVIDLLDDCGSHGFRPVLFSDILEGVVELQPAMEEYRGEIIKSQREQRLWPNGEQRVKFQMHTSLTEVARITSQISTFDALPVVNRDGIVGLPVNR